MTVVEVAAAVGISRSAAYEAVRTGAIPSIRIGHRIVCPTTRIREMLGLDDPNEPAA